MSFFDLTAMLLTLAAVFGASLLLAGVELLHPADWFYRPLRQGLRQTDFTTLVMNGMLAFLIFAGALNLDLPELRNRAWPVAALAVIGTTVSTGLVGGAVWEISNLIGRPTALEWALVFGGGAERRPGVRSRHLRSLG